MPGAVCTIPRANAWRRKFYILLKQQILLLYILHHLRDIELYRIMQLLVSSSGAMVI